MTELSVVEVFGPTVQGEGPSCGRRATFVRLGGCNLDCGAGPGATWACDTPYTWDWTGKLGVKYDRAAEVARVDVADLASQIVDQDPSVRLLVITGGEPMIQASKLPGLVDLVWEWADRLVDVEVETNGTRRPDPDLSTRVSFNVSPKLSNSGVPEDHRIDVDVLAALDAVGARFKFVVSSSGDVDEVAALVDRVAIDPARVWIMPAGRTPKDLQAVLDEIAGHAIAEGFNVTTRLHVQLWGDERGR